MHPCEVRRQDTWCDSMPVVMLCRSGKGARPAKSVATQCPSLFRLNTCFHISRRASGSAATAMAACETLSFPLGKSINASPPACAPLARTEVEVAPFLRTPYRYGRGVHTCPSPSRGIRRSFAGKSLSSPAPAGRRPSCRASSVLLRRASPTGLRRLEYLGDVAAVVVGHDSINAHSHGG